MVSRDEEVSRIKRHGNSHANVHVGVGIVVHAENRHVEPVIGTVDIDVVVSLCSCFGASIKVIRACTASDFLCKHNGSKGCQPACLCPCAEQGFALDFLRQPHRVAAEITARKDLLLPVCPAVIGFERLEPYDGKLSRTVLRGGASSNAFLLPDYASVECMLNPSLKGHPVAVGRDAENRHGIILAKNYEAKKYGIQTGEALWQAKEKCRDLIIVPPNYEEYLKYSRLAHSILTPRYSALIHPTFQSLAAAIRLKPA